MSLWQLVILKTTPFGVFLLEINISLDPELYVYSANPEVLLHLGGPAGYCGQDMQLWQLALKEAMRLAWHLASFHIPPLKMAPLNSKGSYCLRHEGNGTERYSGPSNSRVSWHPLWLVCLILAQRFSGFFKQTIWGLPPPSCWKGHRA